MGGQIRGRIRGQIAGQIAGQIWALAPGNFCSLAVASAWQILRSFSFGHAESLGFFSIAPQHGSCSSFGMPRRPRTFLPGKSVHLMNRGHNRGQVFDDNTDREIFLHAVREASARHDLDVHGFALMKNHFHLLATPRMPEAVSRAMKMFESKYCSYYNRKHQRIGSIWNGRYHDVLIETAWQWLVCLRYIELNPVRAGIVDDPAAFSWTSYGVHAHGSSEFPWLKGHPVLEGLASSAPDRLAIYRALCAAPLSEAEVTLMRDPPSVQLMTA